MKLKNFTKILGIAMMSLGLVNCSEISSKVPPISQVIWEICQVDSLGGGCFTTSVPSLHWGTVKDIKLVKHPTVKNRYDVYVKSQGCVGWYSKPNEENYYWDKNELADTIFFSEKSQPVVKILKTEEVPPERREAVVFLQQNAVQKQSGLVNCQSLEKLGN